MQFPENANLLPEEEAVYEVDGHLETEVGGLSIPFSG
jgi:hypothetical protein